MALVEAPRRIGEPSKRISVEPNSLPAEEAERLTIFLESAEALILSPGTIADPFTENENMRVRIGIMTDGEWVWDLAWADYVGYHKVAPPNAFLEHVKQVGYQSPEISDDRLMEIIEVLSIPLP